jgi:hypothetical protein
MYTNEKNNSMGLRIKSGMTLFAIICFLVTGNCLLVTAQVSIGSATDSVTAGSVLDLSQGYGGLLLPQVTDTTAATRTAGMMVFSQADNTVYTYNDVTSTWTALGSSGGGTYTCSGAGTGTITGLSGNTYCTATYPDATTDLKYLRWTISNLMEAGESATTYEGLEVNPAPTVGQRGYYYTWAVVKPSSGSDICKSSLGTAWRVPTDADWKLLSDSFSTLTVQEKSGWQGYASLAGYRHSGGTWLNWNYNGKWWSSTATDKSNSIDNAGTWATPTTTAGFWLSARCVRYI